MMTQVETSLGPIEHRTTGPAGSTRPVVVFVHGVLVNSHLWDGVADRLARAGVRSVLPDLPLGSHRTPMRHGADRSARGVAAGIADLLERLDLEDVTLVGNNTGGALCQFLVDRHPERVGRLVLTNCDAFEQFPPAPFDRMFKAFRGSPGRIRAAAAPLGSRVLRHSPLGYGLLARDLDPALTAGWVEPARRDPAIRADLAALLGGLVPSELEAVSARLARFDKPARLVWGTGDRFFTPTLGRRLLDTLPRAEWDPVEGARTFVALDAPDAVADGVLAMS